MKALVSPEFRPFQGPRWYQEQMGRKEGYRPWKPYLGPKLNEHNVLIVEDEKDIRDSLRQVLEFEGYKVSTAANGKDALNLLRANFRPDVILLDLMMPIMNGWEFSDLVSRDPIFSDIPIILLTAFSDKTIDVHAKDILRKPIDLNRLIPAIKKYSD